MAEVNLKAAILKTLSFFDIFNYPLTSLEIWQYLYQPVILRDKVNYSLSEVIDCLNQSSELIQTDQGFYFLASQNKNIVDQRKQRYNIAEKKFKKVKRVGRFLALMPFVRLIAVCNTLAYSNASETSDIDLFIITRKGKVWTVRFACLFFLKIFNLRPKPGKERDKFCLSFFVDEKYLNLSSLALPRDDIYLWYWIEQLYPVYDFGGYYQKFSQANIWLREYLPNGRGVESNLRRVIKLCWLGRSIKFLKEKFLAFDFIESLLKKLQLKILPESLEKRINKDPGVVIREGVIKLIANDRREGFRNEWIVKVNNLEIRD